MSSKTGKSALDIFAPTTSVAAPAPEVTPTPVAEHPAPRTADHPQDDWAKVTVLLFNRQVVYLDRLTASIREMTGSSVKRAEVIRALIDTIIESGLEKDLSKASSEDEIRSLLSSKLAS